MRQKSGYTLNASLAASLNQKKKSNKGSKAFDRLDYNSSVDNLNFSRKSLHVSFNPKYDILAIASVNNLFMYQKN
jgi:hypothetical protein